jgi:hypothetical protein
MLEYLRRMLIDKQKESDNILLSEDIIAKDNYQLIFFTESTANSF